MEPPAPRWDVIVVGGALAGSSTANLLLRGNPRRRVLILERSTAFGRRVGESTVENSSYFLGRVLGLTGHLLEHHLPKQGMRFWSSTPDSDSLERCSEIGPGYNVRLPGFQVDRAVLDEHVLEQARAAGAVVERDVHVRSIALTPGGAQRVEWERSGEPRSDSARWVVDASGVAAVLARQEGWLRPNAEHPTAACWSRWSGVKSWDDRDLADKYPKWFARCRGIRGIATNHLTGYGWWAWWIPLKGGDVSIGVTFDQRLCQLPPGPNLGERLRAMLLTHPAARELLANASPNPKDLHYRANLAYVSETFATDGALLVGDAAAFLDPFYSPGMDWISHTATAASRLIDAADGGEPVGPLIARHNRTFGKAYDRWFRALYLDKYTYLGDYELMLIAFRLDLGLYYLGSARQVYLHGLPALAIPSFGRPYSRPAAKFMAWYNRRLAAIARTRQRQGRWGRHNADLYFPFTSYEFNRRLFPRICAAVAAWWWLELREALRAPFARPKSFSDASAALLVPAARD